LSNTEFKFDFSDFNKKFKKIAEQIIPQRAEKGMAKAGMQLLNDSIMQRPTVPIREGTLRGSGSVFVQNKLIGRTPSVKGKGNPATDDSIAIGKNEIVARVGFNTPYAARVHEVPMKFSEPSAGNKYLESKMSKNKNLYFKIVANAIKESAK